MSSYCNLHEVYYKTWDCPLCEDDAALTDNYDELESQVEKLQAENAKLRECVEFLRDRAYLLYADAVARHATQCLKEIEGE